MSLVEIASTAASSCPSSSPTSSLSSRRSSLNGYVTITKKGASVNIFNHEAAAEAAELLATSTPLETQVQQLNYDVISSIIAVIIKRSRLFPLKELSVLSCLSKEWNQG